VMSRCNGSRAQPQSTAHTPTPPHTPPAMCAAPLGCVRPPGARVSRVVYVLDRAALVELDRWLDRFRTLTPAEAPGSGPANRLDALGTELHRGRRARRTAPTRGDNRETG
jgi:hypothetical protein